MSLWNPNNIMDAPPYPADRFNRKPENSAMLRRSDHPEDFVHGPMKFHYLVDEKISAGDCGLYRIEIGPRGGGPGAHYHRAISEAFYVLSGVMRLHDGDKWVDATAGDFLYVPPGGIHGFRNEADEPTQCLLLFAPGAPREAYFEGLAHLAGLTDEQRIEWNHRHDSYFL